MSHAERCPICLGTGELPEDGNYTGAKKKCHGCSGKGWIVVEDIFPIYPQYPYYPEYLPYYHCHVG